MSTHLECINMIKQQLRCGDVLDDRILHLFQTISRENFVPAPYQQFAYSDLQIQLPHNQRMLTPLEEASLLQALKLQGHETVLEIGTGTGFLTALLSKLAKKVISVEYFEDLSQLASKNLATHQCDNVDLIIGDGSRGWLEKAPYDVIIFTGGIDKLTETQKLQIVPGGQIFAIVGEEPIMYAQIHTLDHDNQWQAKYLFDTCIPPLINKLKPKEFVF